MSIEEAAARLRLLQHAFECNNSSSYARGPETQRKAIAIRGYIRDKVDRLRAELLADYADNSGAKRIINAMFRFTEWEKDIHPYSKGYAGNEDRFESIYNDGSYTNVHDIEET